MDSMSDATQTSTAPQTRVLLSPPWWAQANKIIHTIGASAEVRVGTLVETGYGYDLAVVTDDKAIGTGLATILVQKYGFGNVTMTVTPRNSDGTRWAARVIGSVDDLVSATQDALAGNPLLSEVITGRQVPSIYTEVVAVIAARVIQFYNDDLSDFYHNFNGVASDVFAGILTRDFTAHLRLATTTQNVRAS
jgi:hypothetical protein